ncbi:hypothetical protein L9F63_026949, partial [Diploptera punctata]
VWDIRQEGGQAIGFKCDVTDRESVMETALLVQQQVGHVTILVNNAGIYPVKAVLDWTPEKSPNFLILTSMHILGEPQHFRIYIFYSLPPHCHFDIL